MAISAEQPCDSVVPVVELVVTPTINYAMQQNDVPVVRRLWLSNADGLPLADVRVAITAEPAFAQPWEVRLAALAPGESRDLGVADLALSHDYLAALTERVAGALHVTVSCGSRVLEERSHPVEVLAFDQWSGARAAPEVLAAFVTPNHPVVEQILSDVASQLGEWTGERALSGYQSRDRNRVLQTVAAVYAVLQRRGIDYINPPASFEDLGQKIRLPDRIWEHRLGTCLDLALLAASCLEQAGLHSLVVFTAGHAFAGAWLDEDCFADVLTDDVLRLRKRVDAGEIVTFEATALTHRPPVAFEAASRFGRQHLDDESAFRFVVDIARARKSRIRPLPLRAADGSVAATAAPPDLAVDASAPPAALPRLEEAPLPEPSPAETPATRLDRWKRRLLDLSLRNRLLNFRETRKSLPLLCPDPAALEDALADGARFRVHAMPPELLAGSSRAAELFGRRTGDDLADAVLREEFAAKRLHAALTDAELQRRLVEVYRDVRTSLEESGANTLYLALGFLRWREAAGSQDRYAPILLIPLQLERRSLLDGFTIRAADDEPLINTTLLELLLRDHGLRVDGLDPLPHDDSGLDVPLILQRFRLAVKNIDGWDVVESACVAPFSFTKFLMWRDLEVRADALRRNEVVAHLVDTPTEPFADRGDWPSPERLDAEHAPEQTYCLVSLDSTQLAAVVAATQGRSFVLHGPPGTGKSQTITNLIAHAVGQGQSVLFVSEKAAALSVVQRRLVDIGLGPFCLELHSYKTQKLAVLKQLGEALDYSAPRSTDEWQREAKRLAALRRELNGYARALHRRRGSGDSVFSALTTLMRLRNAPEVKLTWPYQGLPEAQAVERCRELARQLQHTALDGGDPRDSVWSPVPDHEWSLAWRDAVGDALGQLDGTMDRTTGCVGQLLGTLGDDCAGWSRLHLGRLADAAEALAVARDLPASLLGAADWPAASRDLPPMIALGQAFTTRHEHLQRRYGADLLQGEWNAAAWPPATARDSAQALAAHVAEPATVFAALAQFAGAATALADRGAAAAAALGVQCDGRAERLRAVAALAGGLVSPPAAAALLAAPDWTTAKETMGGWIALGRESSAAREALLATYQPSLLVLDGGGLIGALAESGQGFVLTRGARRRAVLRRLRDCLRAEAAPSDDEVIEHLRRLAAVQEQDRQLAATASAAELLGPLWRESQTDWEAVSRALGWCEGVRRAATQLAGSTPGRAAEIRGCVARLLADRDELQPDAPLGAVFAALGTALADFDAACGVLDELLGGHAATGALEGSEAGIGAAAEAVAAAWTAYLTDLDRLRQRAADPESLTADDLRQDLAAAAKATEERRQLREGGTAAVSWLGPWWGADHTDWTAVAAAWAQAQNVRAAAARLCADPDGASALCAAWAKVPAEQRGELGRGAASLRVALADLAEHTAVAESVLGVAPLVQGDDLRALAKQVKTWREHASELRDWCTWRAVREQARRHGLADLIGAFEQGAVPAESLADAFERSYARWFAERTIDAEPALGGFRRAQFERTIEDFRQADDRYMALARAEIQATLAARVPRAAQRTSENSEMGILLRQRQRLRGHLTVRALFGQIPTLLPRLKPCLLMSPLSVAQYLDPDHPPFDLVIFDEASQIPVWDAVGAIARGRHVVVVGDPKQLPPTSFFERGEDDDDPIEDGTVEDLESILEDCLAARLPEQHLRWHYRSRHESLIAFSNQQYYANNLLTFPSPHATSAVSLRLVTGVYDKGGSRTNRIEADAVVAEIVRRLTQPGVQPQSIGVVTFNQSQQRLIEDLLEAARRENPGIEPAFGEDAAEPLFVKNLENVQGDERDLILFSIGYGPDATGRISMNFGPLNRDGGARRLNVAITRARDETVVFSSITADHIDLGRIRPGSGVADLRQFLDFAQRGYAALSERLVVDPGADCESPFEEQVCVALRQRGHTVHTQVGCSDYRVDLAVVDPERPGRYLLGIECDGANYHRGQTARDRDRLREQILRGLGWRLHRIWSTDWWERPDAELARAEAAIEAASADPGPAAPPPEAASAALPDELGLEEPPPPPTRTGEPRLYRACPINRLLGDQDAFFAPATASLIQRAFEAVVRYEGPLSADLAARRVAAFWGIKRLSPRVRERLDALVANADLVPVRHGERLFLWPAGTVPTALRGFRRNGPEAENSRDMADIPPEELANAAAEVLKQQVALPREDLERETARMIGFRRVTEQMGPYLRLAVQLLLDRGGANEGDGVIR